MTKNLDTNGLRSIAENYDLFYIDLWGVIHNGLKLHHEAIITLNKLIKINKKFVLLTNAPRPNHTVRQFLKEMGMNEELISYVYTSGEASIKYLKKNYPTEKFFHVGPPKDYDLFRDFKNNKDENIESSKYILCTGLFDEFHNNLNYYKNLLQKYTNKTMICTNPDLIVDRGDTRALCAGSVALVFEKMGGEVVYFGKPYPEVYNQSIDNNKKKILAIGDNLNTDIRGANLLNYDSLLISNGIHRDEIKDKGIQHVTKEYEVIVNYIQSDLKW